MPRKLPTKLRRIRKKEAEITSREAQKKADDILNAANEKADAVLEEASKRAKKLAIETDDLKKNTRVFRQRLQVMLESQLEVIKGSDWDRLVEEKPTTTYEDIEKVVGSLDNIAKPGVQSETKQSNGAEAVEGTPATVDDSKETVVIYPDGSTKK